MQICGSRVEVLKLLRKWDAVNCLQLISAAHSEPSRRCGLFAIPKDAVKLRQILNPLPENARVFGLSEATSKLASAFDLCPWLMKKGETLVRDER